MRDAFDDLERDLRRVVRRRRRRRAQRALVVAVAAVLLLAGVAASQIAQAPDVEREVPVGEPQEAEIERVLFEVVKATVNRPECRMTEQPPPPDIAERAAPGRLRRRRRLRTGARPRRLRGSAACACEGTGLG